MRLQFQKTRSETLLHEASDLAVMLKWRKPDAGWGMLELEHWALSRCSDDARPSSQALVRGAAAVELVARVAGWRKEPERWFEAAEQLPALPARRVVDQGEVCVDLSGLLRHYDEPWEKAKKERDRKKKARDEEEAQTASDASADVPQTEDGSSADREGKKENKRENKNSLPSEEEHAPVEQEELELAPSEPDGGGDLHQHPLEALWDELANPSFRRWAKSTPERRKRADARWREHGPAGWRSIIARVNAAPFLQGKKWFTLDWLLKPENLQKVIEGNYDDGPAPSLALSGIGEPPLRNCVVCEQASEGGAIGEGLFCCYPHVSAFRANAERNGWERPWEHAAEWVANVRAQEVAA